MIALLASNTMRIAASAQATQPATANIASFEIGKIEDTIPSDRVIGKVTSGLACLPKARLYWRDVARPNETEIKTELAKAFESARRAVATGPDKGSSSVRLDLTIASVSLKVCVPWMGIGRAPKGGGSITLTWRAIDIASGKTLSSPSFTEPLAVSGRDPRLDKRVFLDAIDRAIVDYIATPQQSAAIPR